MSKVKPVFISPLNPVGLDKIVAALQGVIAQSFYMNDADVGEFYFDEGLLLPLALKDEQNESPIVYWKEDDYYPALPNDNYRITSFFYQEDSSGFESMNSIQYNLNLVVWFNQDKYVRNKSYQIKEFLITELEGLVRNYLRMEDKTSIEVFRELDAVFSNYKLTPEQKTIMKYPYQAFRIRFSVSADLDCGDAAKLNTGAGTVTPPLNPCDPPETWEELVALVGLGYEYTQPTGAELSDPFRTGDDADIENTVFAPIRKANDLKAKNSLADFLTLNNPHQFADNPGVNGALFNGTTSKVTIPHNANLTFGDGVNDSAFSITSWVNANDWTNFVVYSKNGQHLLRSNADDRLEIYLQSSAGNTLLSRPGALTAFEGQNLFVASTYNGLGSGGVLTLRIYDELGTLLASDLTFFETGAYTAMSGASVNQYIGHDGGSNYADGKVWDTRVHNTELTLAEIEALITNPDSLTGHEVSRWKLDVDYLDSIGVNNGINTDSLLLKMARLTDINGLQVYADNYTVDHYRNIGWYRTSIGLFSFNDGIDNALASLLLGFDNWFMPNINILSSIRSASSPNTYLLPDGFTNSTHQSSTSSPNQTTERIRINTFMETVGLIKTTTRHTLICRKHF